MGEFALGQPVPRFEDPRLLKGGGRYIDDMVLPRMVFGHVLRSPFAHARIRGVDVSRAEAAPGVLLVLTGADWDAAGWRDLPVPSGMDTALAQGRNLTAEQACKEQKAPNLAQCHRCWREAEKAGCHRGRPGTCRMLQLQCEGRK